MVDGRWSMVDGRWSMRGSMEWERMRQNVPMDHCSFITNNIIVRTEPIKMVAISCARLNASVARAQCAPRAAPAFRAAPLRPSRMVRVYLMCPIRAEIAWNGAPWWIPGIWILRRASQGSGFGVFARRFCSWFAAFWSDEWLRVFMGGASEMHTGLRPWL
jgi:hypothetical protein